MYFSRTYNAGRVAEWFKAPVLKTGRGFTPPREFESHPFRHKYQKLKIFWLFLVHTHVCTHGVKCACRPDFRARSGGVSVPKHDGAFLGSR